jgi:eukaryotic-like serine/threonine-protein kinase
VNTNASECLRNEEVGPFLVEQLPDPRQAALEVHIESCGQCQDLIEAWTARANPLRGIPRDGLSLSPQQGLPAQRQPAPVPTMDDFALRQMATGEQLAPTDSLLTGPPREDLSTSSAPDHMEPLPQSDQPQIPGYEILGELGRGGMGVVWKARQIKANRLVALKMLLPSAAGRTTFVDRFQIEAEAVARLRHPNIVQVYEVGEYQGQPYFSLEYLDGGPLSRRIVDTLPSPFDAARLVEILARAMASAHQMNIIHRDLKPANVLLQSKSATALSEPHIAGVGFRLSDFDPKIADFGLAKRLDVELGHTLSGQVMGSPPYMAPEQAQGKREIGPAADIYGLGAILYELLTGRAPFKADSPVDTLRQVVNDEPNRPRRLNQKVPLDLETICLKCLEKEPRRRFPAAVDLADDLARFIRGEPIQSRRVGRVERGWKWARRHPAKAGLAVSLVLVAAAATLGSVFYGLYADLRTRRIEQHAQVIDQAGRLWNAARDAEVQAETALAQGQDAQAIARFREAQGGMEQAQAKLETEPDPELASEIEERLRHVGKRLQELRTREETNRQAREDKERFQKAVEQFAAERRQLLFHDLSIEASERPDNRETIRKQAAEVLARFHLGPTRQEGGPAGLGNFDKLFESPAQRRQVAAWCCEVLLIGADAEKAGAGRRGLETALRLLDQAEQVITSEDLPRIKFLHSRRADYLTDARDVAKARAERAQADATTPTSALDHFLFALQRFRAGDDAGAYRGCEQALDEQSDYFAPQYLSALYHLKHKNWSAAVPCLTACLSGRRDSYWPRLMRATARIELRDFPGAQMDLKLAEDQARTDLERFALHMNRGMLAYNRGLLASKAPMFPDRLALLGRSIVLQGIFQEARDQYLRAAAIRLPVASPLPHVNLAAVYKEMDDPKNALAELGQAIALEPRDGRLYYARAEIERDTKDLTAARRDLNQAIQVGVRSKEEAWLARAHLLLGELKLADHQHRDALKDFDSALRILNTFPKAHLLRADVFFKAHLLRAEALRSDHKYLEASMSLDAYLAAGGTDNGRVYLMRGLIHEGKEELPQAAEAYSNALRLQHPRDPVTLCSRGRVYLQSQAVELALADFEEVLKEHPHDVEALCGRGQIRVLKGKPQQAVEDAAAALKHGKRNPQLLCAAASIYARAARALSPVNRRGTDLAWSLARTANELVDEALKTTPTPEARKQLWNDKVLKDKALSAVVSPGRPPLE